jgi:hypothetical protein
MLTSAQIKKLPKGFHPHLGSNRKQRRANYRKQGDYNLHNGAKLIVTPTSKILMFLQKVHDKKQGYKLNVYSLTV